MRKEGKSVNEEISLKEVILKKVLPKDIDAKDLKVKISCRKPIVEIDILDANDNVLFYGMSKCSPEDTWDDFIGITLAVARLKVNVNAYLKRHDKREKKRFVPKFRQQYWVYYTSSELDGNNIVIYAEKHTWTNSERDYLLLGRGNVFATAREAKKECRRKIFEGRKLAKEARKNG